MAGLIGLIPAVKTAEKRQAAGWTVIAGALVLAGLITFQILRLQTPNISRETGAFGDTLPAAEFLKSYLQPGDTVIVTLPSNYPLKYYFMLNDISEDYYYHRKNGDSFHRAIVVVNQLFGQNLVDVIRQASVQDYLNPADGKVIQDYKGVVLYEFDR